jgi:hypothetical protein
MLLSCVWTLALDTHVCNSVEISSNFFSHFFAMFFIYYPLPHDRFDFMNLAQCRYPLKGT